MLTRRSFLWGSCALPALSLMGCSKPKPIPVKLPKDTIDIHAHIFNGRDIPVSGFLTQVFLREVHEQPKETPINGLFNLLKFIIFQVIQTPSARKEADEIASNNRVTKTSREAVLTQDQENLAKGIEKFAEQVPDATIVAQPTEDQAMLAKLESLLSHQTITPMSNTDKARAIAAQVYEPLDGPAFFGGRKNVDPGNTDWIMTLRWAAMLTRKRQDILAEYQRLYSQPSNIRVISPSVVDFELWFVADEGRYPPSPMQDQIAVMSQIAKHTPDMTILNFFGFCPLRAATENPSDPLKLARQAISNGFAGIKLYPPVGFKPTDNAPNKIYGQKAGRKTNGRTLNHVLMQLYHWCVKNDVPIKTHGMNSLAASENSGLNADSKYWARVLAKPGLETLRVNWAHFGGFKAINAACEKSWDAEAAKLARTYPGFYVDVGFWSEVTSIGTEHDNTALECFKRLLAQDGQEGNYKLADKIMYGSDWSMIARMYQHNKYAKEVKAALTALNLDLDDVMSRNAQRYLWGDRQGAQFERLSKFFGPQSHFASVFSAS